MLGAAQRVERLLRQYRKRLTFCLSDEAFAVHEFKGALRALHVADVGFIDFDGLAFAAHRAGRAVILHGFANAMGHEPSGFVGHAEHTFELLCAHALLGSGHEMEGQNPLSQRDVRAFHDGADSHGELFAAFVALEHAGTSGLALELSDLRRLGIAAMRAGHAVGPTDGFQMLPGRVVVVKDLVGQIHGYPSDTQYELSAVLCQVYKRRDVRILALRQSFETWRANGNFA